jgi:1,4-dihydroxy-2-naphthoate octaprenyltransferase
VNQEIISVRKDAEELKSILFDGTILRHGEFLAALPREVVFNSVGVESIIFEVISSEELMMPSPLWIWFKATRFESLTKILAPGAAVFLVGLLKGWTFSFGVGCLALVGALLFQISVNALNDVEDHLRLVDLPRKLGGSGVIQKGWVSARTLKSLGYKALILGTLCGLPAVFKSPEIILSIGAMGIFGVLAYSNQPFGMKYRALGDFSIFVLGGPLLALGLSQAAFGRWDLSIILLGSFFGFLAWTISHGNHLHHIELDRIYGTHTLASQVGFKWSRHLFASLYLLAGLSLGAGIIFGNLPTLLGIFLAFGILPVVRLISRVYQASGPASALLGSIRFDTAKIHFLLGVLIFLGLMIAYLGF